MGRRKRAFLEDDSDSSAPSQDDDLDEQGFEDDDPDARAERDLFENPYQRNKRRRVNGKDDATYGIFAENDEDEGSRRGSRMKEKRLHFTQAPAFVTGEERKQDQDELLPGDEDVLGGDVDDVDDDPNRPEDADEDSGQTNREVDREAPEDNDPPTVTGGLGSAAHHSSAGMTSLGGIGSGGGKSFGGRTTLHGGIGSGGGIGFESRRSSGGGIGSRGGIGSQGGIGSSRSNLETVADDSLPESFGSASRKPQRSFLRDETGSATSSVPGTPKLSREEQLHFTKLQGSFGARLMAKMGWETGTGLGASAQGIVTPVETKLRPKASMGLAFRGFKERTAQSKAEARRRGEAVSEDEDENSPRKSRAKSKSKQERSDAWKKPKKAKVKVEHQTYEQILQNAGQTIQPPGIGKIYDATGGEMREVSIADLATASWTPSTDTMRIPEVRHNLRLIVDVAKGDLDGLAREGKALEERKKWVQNEDARLRHKVAEEAELISRLQSVHLIIDEIKSQSQHDYELSLDSLSPYIDKLVTEFPKEYENYRLDEIVIGAIYPVVRAMLASWEPLKNPTILADVFRRWRRCLRFTVMEETAEDNTVDIYGTRSTKSRSPVQRDAAMTPYESLMWNAWLPKVRSCINNDWSPVDAGPVIQLYEIWSDILPSFLRDNILDQLVIPKVKKAVVEWQSRTDGPRLQTIVFPWLSHVGPRIEELLGDARRKVKSLLRSWVISDILPHDLLEWKEVFGKNEWETMTLKYILPKLGATLREDFTINPRNQDVAALNRVLQWRPIFRDSVFSQLLEAEFFPKWLDVLHVWLIQPKASFEEVAQWYAFWKSVFPPEVLELQGVVNGFTRGLQLMNKAIELGPDAARKLPRPSHHPPTHLPDQGSRKSTPPTGRIPARVTEVTFRSIVEEFAAKNDLLFIPTGKAHEKSRMPLFRLSHSVDGKGGVLLFILDDAVWAVENDGYRAISLDEMVLRANKAR